MEQRAQTPEQQQAQRDFAAATGLPVRETRRRRAVDCETCDGAGYHADGSECQGCAGTGGKVEDCTGRQHYVGSALLPLGARVETDLRLLAAGLRGDAHDANQAGDKDARNALLLAADAAESIGFTLAAERNEALGRIAQLEQDNRALRKAVDDAAHLRLELTAAQSERDAAFSELEATGKRLAEMIQRVTDKPAAARRAS